MPSSPQVRELVESGRVVETRRGRAIVELDVRPEEAGKKPHCSGCGLCTSAGGGNPELRAVVPEGLDLSADDRVEVRLRLASSGAAAMLLFGVPLLLFLGASFAGWLLTGSEPVAAAAGFSGLTAGFVVLFAADRIRGPRATVTRKL